MSSNNVDHYRSYRAWVRQQFGSAVLKIPVNAGFSCPNRDGVKSNNGCLFCDNRSFSPAAEVIEPVLAQMQRAIAKASPKFKAFIAYLQPFSNTYGSVDLLASVYEPIITLPNVVGLAIGTRPDCFSKEHFDYLFDLSQRTYLSIEIGLQSAHDATLAAYNRGHTVRDFQVCVEALSKRGIETVAHVMLGLEPEGRDMMMATARYVAALPVTGVKIHQVMVILGTPLERRYREGRFKCLTLEEYAALVSEFLSLLRPDQLIHRIVADSSARRGLIAPMWSAEKMQALRFIHEFMDGEKTMQGSKWVKGGN